MSISKILSIGSLCLLLSATVFAQNPPSGTSQDAAGGAGMPQTKSFNVDAFVTDVDTNKDGFMTKEEFKAAGLTDRMFLTPPFCDPDGDEKISKKEMAECKLPEAVDMDKDGKISKDEMLAFEGTDLGKERGPGVPKAE